nr:DUF2892 domain-containing protein [Deltaproteobacteria bacterium]
MKENVGGIDQKLRSIAGPVLLALGYNWFGGKQGRFAGLAAMISGALLTETAITKTCPLNELLGIDTREALPA